MKIGEWLKTYREQHGLSMQALADLCGFSKAYINVLEKGVNPKTGKSISPTMQTFEKIARATKTDVDTLLKILDGDQPITLNSPDDLPALNAKDEREITRMMDKMKETLMQEEGLMFDGQPASPESIQSILDAMQIGMEMAKKRNKAKYTPKKYRHED
ncbi:helix-turn-helix transcriptional regulator [uncultured Selenomonas sp.]|uniref:helix-turn-helix domain-containing protein n=1 Tax=uncultured Selenomonas sp. TaxID=159275 RepID=UPI0028D79769|nr:helix-turn-helix transcriptional regulator [uncultured Selenomonas sp.]